MTSPTRAFQGAENGRPELGAVTGALAARYTVVAGEVRIVRCRRLDTFDERLRAAGVNLEHQTGSAGRQLVLTRADGSTAVVAGDLRWPALAGNLPSGPVRDAVAPVAGIRALAVVGDERRSWRRIDLHNEDGKTVARVDLDEPLSADGAPGLLTLRGLRGYDADARRVGGILEGLDLRPVEPDSTVPAVSPRAARIDPRVPADVLLAGALGDFRDAMRTTLPGILDDVDTEFLHDFRVALRRTRTTLRLGRPVLPAALRTEWEPEFKWLGDLTSPVRDLDVYELGLPVMSGWLAAADPADLEAFGRHLAARRTHARRTMVRGLRSARFRRLQAGWDRALADLAESSSAESSSDPAGASSAAGSSSDPDGAEQPPSAGDLAARSLARAFRRVARDGAAISGGSPAQDLHRLRGRCKELRYALEVFAPVADVADVVGDQRAIADLRGLQDVLGRFQDAEVQRHALREFADEMMTGGVPAAALLALGELIAHLEAEQTRARREFDRAFTRFVRSSRAASPARFGGGT